MGARLLLRRLTRRHTPCDATTTDAPRKDTTMGRIHLRAALRSPNVMSLTYHCNGTAYTLYRSTPGDASPRMQVQSPGEAIRDWGSIADPSRFGPVGTTLVDFERWCLAYIEAGITAGAVIDEIAGQVQA